MFEGEDLQLGAIDGRSIIDPSSNPLLPLQWYAAGSTSASVVDSRASQVWGEYTGRGVSIAVVDIGFQSTHLDLTSQLGTGALGAYSASNDHATQVTGVVGADAANGVGIAGIAYGADIEAVALNYLSATTTRSDVAAALSTGANSDVVNASWGYRSQFQDNFRDGAFSGIAASITGAAATGRDGLGSALVFAAGNDRQYVRGSATQDGDNTNYHSLTNARQIITVAASDETGKVASFSTPGASVLVAAPGTSIYTSGVIAGRDAATDGFETVSGTSFAAPIVSGVIALMLEANPDLGYRDIQTILAASATRTGAPTGWIENGASWWNGGGLLVNSDLGSGVVNAQAAVQLAETWDRQSTASNELNRELTAQQTGAQTFADGQSVSMGFQAASGLEVEWVEVDVAITHLNVGDLTITVTSPSGTTSVLVDRPGAGNNTRDNLVFTLTSAQFRGEASDGVWTVRVTDAQGNGGGRVDSMAVSLHGSTATADTTHIFTDDFAIIPGSATVVDRDGHNTLNLSALTGAASIDLGAGAGNIAGRALTIDANSIFDSIFGGGNVDSLNAAGLSRGVMFDGRAGNDVLVGGAGADTLLGGSGDDTIGFDKRDLQAGRIDGGDGYDTADHSRSSENISFHMAAYSTEAFLGGSGDEFVAAGDLGSRGAFARLGAGNDLFYGSEAGDNANGGSGIDVLYGCGGNDTLTGGLDGDWLCGGAGADIFRYEAFSDSTVAKSDYVFDFSTAEGDRIDLSAVTRNGATFNQGYGTGTSVYAFSMYGITMVQLYSGTHLEMQMLVGQASMARTDFIL